MEFRIDPNKDARSTTGTAGTTSATGLPWRVMRIGCLVLLTCSNSARHFALNSEMGTSVIRTLRYIPTAISYHSQKNGRNRVDDVNVVMNQGDYLTLRPFTFETIQGGTGGGELLGGRGGLGPGFFLQLQN